MILNNKYHLTQYKKNSMKKQFHNYTINEDINFYICSQWRRNVVFKAMISDLIFHITYLHAWIIKDGNDFKIQPSILSNNISYDYMSILVHPYIHYLSIFIFEMFTKGWLIDGTCSAKKNTLKHCTFTHCL